MRRIAVDIEHALALQLKVTLADDASLLTASSGIGERVLCVLLYAEAVRLPFWMSRGAPEELVSETPRSSMEAL